MNWLPYIVMLGLVVAGLGIVWRLVSKAETSGKAEAENAAKGKALEGVSDHAKVEVDVAGLAADERRKRLQQWSRD